SSAWLLLLRPSPTRRSSDLSATQHSRSGSALGSPYAHSGGSSRAANHASASRIQVDTRTSTSPELSNHAGHPSRGPSATTTSKRSAEHTTELQSLTNLVSRR